ncbi:MAG: serine hydrolase [Burkholderiaceae bacterium]
MPSPDAPPPPTPRPPIDEPIATAQQLYDGRLPPDLVASTMRGYDRLYPSRVVRRGPRTAVLPVGEPLPDFTFASGGHTFDLVDYLAFNRVAGLLVLKDGRIRHESHHLGNDERTRWGSMSVAKSVTSTLAGIALHEGLIGSLDDDVTRYLPRLSGSGYQGVNVRQVLRMCSGVQWNETYVDPASDRRRMLAAQDAQQGGAVLELMASLPRIAEPGTRFNYSTGETHILGALVRAAVGRPLADYLSETIWQPCGMESDASWWLEAPDGLEVGGSGIAATLRDYGRFGQFLIDGGYAGGRARLPDGWLDEAGTHTLVGGEPLAYGYMLWPVDAGPRGRVGSFAARGIFGQHIYMHPAERLVIVVWGALPKPKDRVFIDDTDFFRAVTEALR